MADYADELRLALELADIADSIGSTRFRAPDLVVDRKPNGSPVTDADRAIEAAVVERLRRLRPAIPIVGEEHGTYDGAATFWALDPIDGTAAFIAGELGWGFTLCLVEHHRPVVGVASSVALGRRWWAALGHGAFSTDLPAGGVDRLRVSETRDLRRARIGLWDGNAWTFGRRSERLEAIAQLLGPIARSTTESGSAALDVAAGRLDAAIMWANDEAPWDDATFAVLVREAGGAVSDLDRGRVAVGRFVLLSNAWLHDRMLTTLDQPPR